MGSLKNGAIGLTILLGGLASLVGDAQPVNAMPDGFVRNWIVLGPFPNPYAAGAQADGGGSAGFYTDYLGALGGEPGAALTEATAVTFADESGQRQTVHAVPVTIKDSGYVDLRKTFNIGACVAYAYCIVQSDAEQTVSCGFGSNDSALVWVNGQLAHSEPSPLSTKRWTYEFPVHLKPGANSVLVKVCDWGGMAWEFVMELYRQDAPVVVKRRRCDALRAFQECTIQPKSRWDYVFPPGGFPELAWDKPEVVEKALSSFPLTVRWFNAALEETAKAEQPGRYAALVDGTAANGTHVRRALTFYCQPAEWRLWDDLPRVQLEFSKGSPFDAAALKEHSPILEPILGERIIECFCTSSTGAAIAAGMAEMKSCRGEPSPMDSPLIVNDEFLLALKRQLLGVNESTYPALALPRKSEGSPAPVLRAGPLKKAGVTREGVDAIRRVCQQWYEETNEPFTVLLARHGTVFFHEAFGTDLDRPMWMASITKALTGLLFAQFLDQGLIALDDPVGKFLPDFPVEGEKVVTLRHCLTHTTGLEGHGMWGGMHNPWLDNVIANGLEYLEPGAQYGYTGMGFELAGKVMETVTGRSISRLAYEQFFAPLGIRTFHLEDLGGGAKLNVEELARVGQLLLNRGEYGDRVFFSPATFELLQPQPLSNFFPGVDTKYGIGLTWMTVEPWVVEKFAAGRTTPILSGNVIGHGAASGAILRVDLDNGLVIAQARNNQAGDYEPHVVRFLAAISDALIR